MKRTEIVTVAAAAGVMFLIGYWLMSSNGEVEPRTPTESQPLASTKKDQPSKVVGDPKIPTPRATTAEETQTTAKEPRTAPTPKALPAPLRQHKRNRFSVFALFGKLRAGKLRPHHIARNVHMNPRDRPVSPRDRTRLGHLLQALSKRISSVSSDAAKQRSKEIEALIAAGRAKKMELNDKRKRKIQSDARAMLKKYGKKLEPSIVEKLQLQIDHPELFLYVAVIDEAQERGEDDLVVHASAEATHVVQGKDLSGWGKSDAVEEYMFGDFTGTCGSWSLTVGTMTPEEVSTLQSLTLVRAKKQMLDSKKRRRKEPKEARKP